MQCVDSQISLITVPQSVSFTQDNFYKNCNDIKKGNFLGLMFCKCVSHEFTDFMKVLNKGGLNKKEIQLNLCNIFSIFIFNELYLFA